MSFLIDSLKNITSSRAFGSMALIGCGAIGFYMYYKGRTKKSVESSESSSILPASTKSTDQQETLSGVPSLPTDDPTEELDTYSSSERLLPEPDILIPPTTSMMLEKAAEKLIEHVEQGEILDYHGYEPTSSTFPPRPRSNEEEPSTSTSRRTSGVTHVTDLLTIDDETIETSLEQSDDTEADVSNKIFLSDSS